MNENLSRISPKCLCGFFGVIQARSAVQARQRAEGGTMSLVSFALRRPTSLLMTIVAAALVDFLAIDRMARDIFPDLGVPVIAEGQGLIVAGFGKRARR
jgi:hypothetical protein